MNFENDENKKRKGFFRRFFTSGGWSLTSEARHQSSYSLAISTPPTERRPLRTHPTVGPSYKINPNVLAKSFVEKQLQYLGTTNDVTPDFDVNNRNSVLSLIDEKRRLLQFPNKLGYRNDVVCTFSIHNLKISWRDGEYVIHRVPTHKISSAGFVQDDVTFYIFLQFASELSENANSLAIFCADNQMIAEEFCSLIQQIFELVYTETTMDFFDNTIQDGAETPKNLSYSTDGSVDRKLNENLSISQRLQLNIQRFLPDFASCQPISRSNKSEDNSSAPATINLASPVSMSFDDNVTSSEVTTSLKRHRSKSDSSSEASTNKIPASEKLQNMTLQQFIALLRQCLDNEEISEFARYLHRFRTGGLPIDCFLDQAFRIYTDKRKSLLLGMRSFIPTASDLEYFDQFLHEHQISSMTSPSMTSPSTKNSEEISESLEPKNKSASCCDVVNETTTVTSSSPSDSQLPPDDDVISESQQILRSGDDDVTNYKYSKVEVKTRDNTQRSKTPEEFGAPFPPFVASYVDDDVINVEKTAATSSTEVVTSSSKTKADDDVTHNSARKRKNKKASMTSSTSRRDDLIDKFITQL